MAKQNRKVAPEDSTSAARAPKGGRAENIEDRVLAFARQVGYVAGTIQTKTEGWMDRKTLRKQLAGMRDGAAQLLEQLGKGKAGAGKAKRLSRAARKTTHARSGGAVDAPGKTHRKRPPSDPNVRLTRSQAPRMRQAVPLEKRTAYRSRG